ncbi:Activating signal cointegrator 1 complex subunit 1 [Plecturocebus cupreus]
MNANLAFSRNCEIDLEIKRYFCRAGVKSIQLILTLRYFPQNRDNRTVTPTDSFLLTWGPAASGWCLPSLPSVFIVVRVEHDDMISAHCSLCLPGSSNSPASASQVAEITGTHHHARLLSFYF